MAPFFSLPMWEQRRICIARVLRAHRAQRVLEVGCGGGNILAFLVPPGDAEHPITDLCGVDVSADALQLAAGRLEPTAADRRDLRVDALRVRLFLGDALTTRVADAAPDAVVCSEVIEHVAETQVEALTHAVLGSYAPRVAVFTTPNAEFNANFPALAYATPAARLRNADHKFEWTRAQFSCWARAAARRYGYRVELRGIGLLMRNPIDGFAPLGGCSQMAVFVRDSPASAAAELVPVTAEPALFATFDYLVYALPPLPEPQLRSLVLDTVRAIAAGNSGSLSLKALWAVLEIRHQFRHHAALCAWLTANPDLVVMLPGDPPCLALRT
ncbi:hypothetical protein H4R26_001908 [Coemansia thaxteri]|uniref:Small RNA 2'-O-methyltransferase n=1 Tax=Coemansia thaxteri TaxID=2663907 RepID=A0A9W8BJT9_9FUNG|nr:hypothetical protein H4R26_001908 [Coemansia thaxteri]KAJ2486540.1 hypothetical protein EV174_001056 [Coemansia sp. RSA 2320]